jgi:ribosomal protein L37AE/L43A
LDLKITFCIIMLLTGAPILLYAHATTGLLNAPYLSIVGSALVLIGLFGALSSFFSSPRFRFMKKLKAKRNICPTCGGKLIRRVDADGSIKWFCPSCKHGVDVPTTAMRRRMLREKRGY